MPQEPENYRAVCHRGKGWGHVVRTRENLILWLLLPKAEGAIESSGGKSNLPGTKSQKDNDALGTYTPPSPLFLAAFLLPSCLPFLAEVAPSSLLLLRPSPSLWWRESSGLFVEQHWCIMLWYPTNIAITNLVLQCTNGLCCSQVECVPSGTNIGWVVVRTHYNAVINRVLKVTF